jgi:penicillin-binding protein 1C
MRYWRGPVKWIGLSLVGVIAWWFCVPDPLFNASYSTVLLDQDDNLLGARLATDGQWRFPEQDLMVPVTFEKAIVQFEDKRFYQHGGVDLFALMRACKENFQAREVVSGGSTLTMQVMRLARNHQQRNLWQKAVEMLWALRFEVTHSKKEILRLYAAHAPFGGNVVGLGAASWRYYHKTPDQLSWGEAAALAVLPNAPGMIYPGKNRDAFLRKRNKLINELSKKGIIDGTEASLALQEPLPGEPLPLPDLAPHLLGHYATSGKTLHSTLDMALQERLTELLQRHADILSLNSVNNAALFVMETETGQVKAYIGNVSHDTKAHQNDVDIIQSERSSGSILKPFLYCSALQRGIITPKGLVEDIPTYIRGYQPVNFSRQYVGMVPADQALAMSLNVPAVRLLQQYGILPFKEKLVDAGITTLHYSPEYYGLPLVLGGAEVKLWDICGAYASMGRILAHVYKYDHQYSKEDIHAPLIFDGEGQNSGTASALAKASAAVEVRKAGRAERPEWKKSELTNEAPVWSAGAIWSTFEAMSTLRRPDQEGQWETFESSKRIAWKTGTSFGSRDAWAVGVTPKYTIGVWIGNADGEGRPGVIGLYAAAPVLFDVLRMLDSQDEWWSPPYDELQPMVICRQSGWLAGPTCMNTDTAYFIRGETTPKVCQYHEQVYTDAKGHYRYDPSCMPESAVLNNYFIVPALAESYYKRYHPEYRTLPPLSPDCQKADASGNDMAIIYPRPGSKIYVPYEWDKQKSRAVFSAVHRTENVDVYWHLDQQYIGKTHEFHQIEVDPKPGKHTLVLQDEFGGMTSTTFEVLENAAHSH